MPRDGDQSQIVCVLSYREEKIEKGKVGRRREIEMG